MRWTSASTSATTVRTARRGWTTWPFEIFTERGVDASMGLAIDSINEYEEIEEGDTQQAGQVVGGVPERD